MSSPWSLSHLRSWSHAADNPAEPAEPRARLSRRAWHRRAKPRPAAGSPTISMCDSPCAIERARRVGVGGSSGRGARRRMDALPSVPAAVKSRIHENGLAALSYPIARNVRVSNLLRQYMAAMRVLFCGRVRRIHDVGGAELRPAWDERGFEPGPRDAPAGSRELASARGLPAQVGHAIDDNRLDQTTARTNTATCVGGVGRPTMTSKAGSWSKFVGIALQELRTFSA